MRRVAIIAEILLLIGWLTYPYLSDAYTPAEPTTRPAIESILSHTSAVAVAPHPFREIYGHDGFWRLGEDQTGVWWFVSPAGQLDFLNTVTTVQPEQSGRDRDAIGYRSLDWDGKYGQADLNRWAEATLVRVKDYGFKGLGAWCNPAFHRLDVPMSQDLNLWAWVNDNSKRFYSAGWAESAEQAVKTQVAPLKDNRNLVGYFLDNELDWGDGFSGPGAYFDDLPNTDPNRQQVVQTIRGVWPQLHDFNLDWSTKLADWSQLDTLPVLPRDQARAYDHLSTAWLYHLAHDYFRETTSLVHRYDPNHLILGVRFKGFAPEEVVSASRDFTDAQSLNYYVADARLDADMFHMMYVRSGQPIIISEYSFHAMDGSSGDHNSVGFSAQVPDQQARADGYRLMTTRLARVPYIVGADWFQWCDEPPAGRSSDGEDVNFGVVDVHDKPYKLLVSAIQQTTPTLNPLHARSTSDSESDIWRESYTLHPIMHVPFLAHAPAMDGTLAGWPQASRFDNIRREQTVDLDRFKIRTPEAFMGWTRDGLYLAVEVFDKHLETAPATAWWWTRDNVEFFISTRPVASDQMSYDVYCHQFFVVPRDPTTNAAVVGQWHRDGDALKDNLIPVPSIRRAVKILPDRYIVELFIPAKALHGYDPQREPTMAFNLDVRDYDTASNFFWSAPKSMRTELRPNTWGTLYLDPPTNSTYARAAQASAN
ncbi:MAG TPA: sugar-binding protein [Tepidisphaeraceae bacterium]|nr:sugar-binding protein [Tepidisphaeraceae bacterium]